MSTKWVVACIPYYRCQRYVRRAVESLLAQTHRELTVVVLNDADHETPPWPALADIRDSRLVRFDLAENRGPYFATQVTLLATSAPYLLIQDADDWSHPERVARLLAALERDGAGLAVSAQPQFRERPDGAGEVVEVRWQRLVSGASGKDHRNGICRFQVDTQLTPEFRYRSPHHGLFRVSALRGVGGYHSEFRIGYDTLAPNLILMTGKIAHTPDPLYYRLIRSESLTHSEATGVKSAASREEQRRIAKLYAECYARYVQFLCGDMGSRQLYSALQSICRRSLDDRTERRLLSEAMRLREQCPAFGRL